MLYVCFPICGGKVCDVGFGGVNAYAPLVFPLSDSVEFLLGMYVYVGCDMCVLRLVV